MANVSFMSPLSLSPGVWVNSRDLINPAYMYERKDFEPV